MSFFFEESGVSCSSVARMAAISPARSSVGEEAGLLRDTFIARISPRSSLRSAARESRGTELRLDVSARREGPFYALRFGGRRRRLHSGGRDFHVHSAEQPRETTAANLAGSQNDSVLPKRLDRGPAGIEKGASTEHLSRHVHLTEQARWARVFREPESGRLDRSRGTTRRRAAESCARIWRERTASDRAT